jgi:hypothetical protein
MITFLIIFGLLFIIKLRFIGLALAIVKNRAELHFGRITVTSEENKWSEFFINIEKYFYQLFTTKFKTFGIPLSTVTEQIIKM